MADRTMSSPQIIRINPFLRDGKPISPPSRFSEMTPPASPLSSKHSRSSTDLSGDLDDLRADFKEMVRLRGGFAPPTPKPTMSPMSYTRDGTLTCPYETEILTDSYGRNQTFGYGAWSTVFKGTCRQARAQNSGLETPPLSPHLSPPIIVAIKKPARKDAVSIIESEAKILTHLMSQEEHGSFVVRFFGIVPSESSIVLAAVPHSLEAHIKHCAIHAVSTRTTWNMTEPVIGSQQVWLDLACKLVSALDWLHNEAMVVHGDIKPGNILISSTMSDENDQHVFPFVPLFADFSSSQILDQNPTPNTLSAVTREYTAPELLSSKVLLDPNSTATTESDVFSLAVTLLVAATGNTMVYFGSIYQRQAMATQGWGILSHVRNSDDGIRLPRQGVVLRCLERAVLKAGMGRIDASDWKQAIERMKMGEPSKA